VSASEKLKALDAEFPNKLTAPTSYVLIAALPQIVAVVEAAEEEVRVQEGEVLNVLVDALAALDEALS
jgi:hypothetical protein